MQRTGLPISGGGAPPASSTVDSTIVLDVICPEVDGFGQVIISRNATVQQLKQEACGELFISMDTVDLWDFFGGQCYSCLEDKLGSSVSSVRIMDRQAVLLKSRPGCTPAPQPALDPTAFARPPDMALVFDDGSYLACHRWILGMASHLLQDVLSHLPETWDPDCLSLHLPPSHLSVKPGQILPASTAGTAAGRPASPTHPSTPHQFSHHISRSHSDGAGLSRTTSTTTATTTTSNNQSLPSFPHSTSNSLPASLVISSLPAHLQNSSPHATAYITPATPPATPTTTAPCSHASTSSGTAGSMYGASCSTGSTKEEAVRLAVLRVPGDDRFAWTFVLKLLYPASQMRRPPVTWSNVGRILALADKWALTSVTRVCEDFLLQPSTQLSISPTDPGHVWKWLVTADRLHMAPITRKCIQFIAAARLSTSADVRSLEKSVAGVVTCLTPETMTSLICSLIQTKDELRAQMRE